jgi:hypothetical protein
MRWEDPFPTPTSQWKHARATRPDVHRTLHLLSKAVKSQISPCKSRRLVQNVGFHIVTREKWVYIPGAGFKCSVMGDPTLPSLLPKVSSKKHWKIGHFLHLSASITITVASDIIQNTIVDSDIHCQTCRPCAFTNHYTTPSTPQSPSLRTRRYLSRPPVNPRPVSGNPCPSPVSRTIQIWNCSCKLLTLPRRQVTSHSHSQFPMQNHEALAISVPHY